MRSTNRDEGQVILLFNGFQKKSQKTPTGEIERALKIRTDYFNEKRLLTLVLPIVEPDIGTISSSNSIALHLGA